VSSIAARPSRTAVLGAVLALLLGLWLAGCATEEVEPATPAPPAPDPGLDSGLVHTGGGAVRGVVADGYRLFYGIPYAAPPVGALRWQAPQPAAGWPGERDATRPGPRCIQDTRRDPGSGHGDSEDCLNLNVWSPAGASGLPVLVWIHGGGFASGDGAMYNAARLATGGNIVVVTVNYRLGALGFLAHSALGEGNYGLADQQAALRWVADNIGGFGGDPAKVTIAGESAGAMSVCDHLVAPGSTGLFRAAIIASGPCQKQTDLRAARIVSAAYARDRGCPDDKTAAACLRALPATALTSPPWYIHMGDNWLTGPATGTSLLPVNPVDRLGTENAARVPMLIGTTADEFTLFPAMQYLRTRTLPTAADYSRLITSTFGSHAAVVLAEYPVAPGATDAQVVLQYARTVTDGVFACPAARMAGAQSAVAPVYAYQFDDPDAVAPESMRHLPFPIGAGHALDLRYLFDIAGGSAPDVAQRALSAQMIRYWGAFVTNATPNAEGAPDPDWPQLADAAGAGPVMSLQPDGSRPISTFTGDHRCAFWAGLAS